MSEKYGITISKENVDMEEGGTFSERKRDGPGQYKVSVTGL